MAKRVYDIAGVLGKGCKVGGYMFCLLEVGRATMLQGLLLDQHEPTLMVVAVGLLQPHYNLCRPFSNEIDCCSMG